MVRYLAAFTLATVFSISVACGLTIDINPDADAFVRSLDPTHNYGLAGALSVSGSSAVNGSGQQMGLLDSFMRFSLAPTIGQFNTTFGAGNWTITGISLQLTETPTPNQTIFNRGTGLFEVRWLANDSLVEGTGTPMAPTTDGITYNGEGYPLSPGSDLSLGTFTNAGTATKQTFALPTGSSAFLSDVTGGNEVEFFLTAASSTVGFTFNSKDFVTPSGRPILEVTAVAVPEPAMTRLLGLGAVALWLRASDVKVSKATRRMGRLPPANKSMGFTLIELLVVLTIVAVLAALLLTAIASVRANADVAESVSRLRQWGMALGLYVADNDGSLPHRGQGVQPLQNIDRASDWFNALPPYLGSPSYQQLCDSGRRPKAGDKSIFVSPGCPDPGGQYFLSYAMNMNLSPWNLEPSMISQIANAPFVVFMAEAPGQYSSTYPSRAPYSVAAPLMGKGQCPFSRRSRADIFSVVSGMWRRRSEAHRCFLADRNGE